MFPTKIVLATDGSEEARHAAHLAADLAETLDSELHLVSKSQPLSLRKSSAHPARLRADWIAECLS